MPTRVLTTTTRSSLSPFPPLPPPTLPSSHPSSNHTRARTHKPKRPSAKTKTNDKQQLALCAVVQLALAVVAVPVKHVVQRSQANNGWLDRFFQANVGFGTQKPKNHEFVALLFLFQMCASFVVVLLWVFKTYAHEVTAGVFATEMVCVGFIAAHYAINMCKFSGGNVWSSDALLDVFTVVPLFAQTSLIKTWISWSFLRAVRAFKAYARLESSGALDDVSDFTRAIVLAILKFVALLISFAGVMYVVEVLGDFDSFYDVFVDAAMGPVSFYQMLYFVMVTVSTVGYGDYSPVTVLGRLCIIVFIIAGVAFFSIETGNLLDILALTSSGKGRYHPRKKNGTHVVVAGGAVAQPNGQVIISFLREICHANHEDCPEVVLLALRPPSDELRAQINATPKLKDNVRYICGSSLLKEDLSRVRANTAAMLYVLGDMSSENPDKEDEENILRGSMLNKLLPQINLRLMLLRPENRQIAADMGLPVYMCFSVDEIKSNMMAMSCRCPVFGTVILNLMKQDNNNAIEAKAKIDKVATAVAARVHGREFQRNLRVLPLFRDRGTNLQRGGDRVLPDVRRHPHRDAAPRHGRHPPGGGGARDGRGRRVLRHRQGRQAVGPLAASGARLEDAVQDATAVGTRGSGARGREPVPQGGADEQGAGESGGGGGGHGSLRQKQRTLLEGRHGADGGDRGGGGGRPSSDDAFTGRVDAARIYRSR